MLTQSFESRGSESSQLSQQVAFWSSILLAFIFHFSLIFHHVSILFCFAKYGLVLRASLQQDYNKRGFHIVEIWLLHHHPMFTVHPFWDDQTTSLSISACLILSFKPPIRHPRSWFLFVSKTWFKFRPSFNHLIKPQFVVQTSKCFKTNNQICCYNLQMI